LNYDVYTWGPLIWRSKLSEDIVENLLTRGNKIRNQEEFNSERDLAMNTHDEWKYPLKDVVWFSESIKVKIKDYMNIWAKHLGCAYDKLEWGMDSLWINYMKQNDFNPLHDHKGNVSFIVYLNNVDELKTEKERFNMTNNGPIPGSIMFCHNDERKYFFPSKGDMFIFPSNTLHLVVPYKTDIERISVSGNIMF
jgi:hypothetical protein